MIRKIGLAAFAIMGCMTAAQAADNRIRTQAYDPNAIVKILGKAGIQSTIEFAADERIENVAVGDSSAWQITPNRRASLLFVKPLNSRSRTNMTVVTDRRTYMFDLVAGDRSTMPVYALKFSYPNDKPLQMASKPVQQAAASPVQSQATMTADKLHFDWDKKGSGKLLPARVFDDGASLYMAWDRETPLPAILTVSEDRKEGPVNYRMSGEYIVVSPIPGNLILRYGSKYAQLWPTRRITPAPKTSPNAAVGRMAAAASTVQSAPPANRPIAEPSVPQVVGQAAPQHATPTESAIKLANVTALYSDQLTDADHEQ